MRNFDKQYDILSEIIIFREIITFSQKKIVKLIIQEKL